MEEGFTLAQLAERLGMQPRTIRSYIEQGLLRGPEIGGRGARYSEYHAQRLQAIRTLKELRRLPLGEVRRRLMVVTGPEIAALARESELVKAPTSGPGAVSALDYLRSINSGGRQEQTSAPAQANAPAQEGYTPVDILLARLDRAGARPARRARGEVWTLISVTPDVEIRVRGAQTPDELARWERIADHLREILTGGAQEE